MNREIKFRVWDKFSKSLLVSSFIPVINLKGKLYFLDICSGNGGDTIYTETDGERFIIQQYIGLKDVEGKEIYEGDIVKEEWDAPIGHMFNKYIIKFGVYEDGEGFKNLGFYKDYTCNPKEDKEIESGGNIYPKNDRWLVIGNIFKNPELLNESSR